jgi:hypothetical protein
MTATTVTNAPFPSIGDLPRALRAEVYKLRHSTIPITVIVLPAAIVGLLNLILPLAQTGRTFRTPGNSWLTTTVGMLQVWAFIQAFIVAVITAQLAGLEHNNNTWKHLFALPVSRKAIYLAKVLVALGLFGISSLLILFGVALSGLALHALRPAIGFSEAIPWGEMLGVVVANYLASWLMITIHAWAGVQWSNFGPSVGLAMVAFLLNMVMIAQPAFQRIFPWSLPTSFFVAGPSLTGQVISPELAVNNVLLSAFASLVVVGFSAWRIARRDVL